MSHYTKLWSDIVSSTIWSEDDQTRIVWITLLALSDSGGYVGASIPGLAHQARVDLSACERAISKLCSPDTYSRSKEYEGRRLREVNGGWIIINYEKHREALDEEIRRAGNRERQQRFRNKHKNRYNNTVTRDVTRNNARDGQAEAEAEAEAEELNTVSLGENGKEVRLPSVNHPHFKASYAAFDRWSHRAPPAGRGHGMNPQNDEFREVAKLLDTLDQCTPIIRAEGESVPRAALLAEAVEGLANEGCKFKSIKFAIGCAKNRLEEWAKNGQTNKKSSATSKERNPWKRAYVDD